MTTKIAKTGSSEERIGEIIYAILNSDEDTDINRICHDGKQVYIEITPRDRDGMIRVRRAMAKLIGAQEWRYQLTEYSATYRLEFDEFLFEIYLARSAVCTRIETGEMETVEVPDYSNVPKKTITRPKVEWICT